MCVCVCMCAHMRTDLCLCMQVCVHVDLCVCTWTCVCMLLWRSEGKGSLLSGVWGTR